MPTPQLPDSVSALARQLRDEQVARWQRGEQAPAEEYLQRHPALGDDPDGLFLLVETEIELRRAGGATVELPEYLRRFPQLEARLRQRFAILESTDPLPATEPMRRAAGALPAVPGFE